MRFEDPPLELPVPSDVVEPVVAVAPLELVLTTPDEGPPMGPREGRATEERPA